MGRAFNPPNPPMYFKLPAPMRGKHYKWKKYRRINGEYAFLPTDEYDACTLEACNNCDERIELPLPPFLPIS